ncbi:MULTISPECIES: DUF302 domain-containing protein [unclassified Halomonas]|uniref:DUF302 domain-containing protein n=1 Tax=unclassified Halomonas TaxID=2609666 RepID=UPI00288890FD|nr:MULTISPECIES: DUF302 domain-containing protein [unclassified Halomonas]MDT0499822.1 DUF302 domain-containing protein [Halomonas sp. PAR7]MDT0510361.1 DUF302 domain-containing protein [Halomonas sp. LES1]MDT0589930.1 DUF302 domain-containing protein [Halomonas sp. PAR8]
MRKLAASILLGGMLIAPLHIAMAQDIPTVSPREGWAVHDSDKSYQALVEAVKTAAKDSGLGVVTEAGPTQAAADRGIEIPGNRVIGLFNNEYAVRILRLSTAAMIEAPIRMYVTEAPDGTATLSYKLPSHVYEPYMEEGGEKLAQAAEELEQDFASIADAALD